MPDKQLEGNGGQPETLEERARREYRESGLVLTKAWEERVIRMLVRAYRWEAK